MSRTVFEKIKIEKEKCIIDYDAFLNFQNLNDFKIGKPLTKEPLLEEIYSFYYDEYNPPYMMYSPNYWEYSKNGQGKSYKHMFIKLDDDIIALTFKITSIMKIKFLLVMDIPMSKNKNEDNIRLILKKLKDLTFTRFVFKEKYLEYYSDIFKNEYSDYIIDFYFDVEKQLEKHTKKYLNQIKVPRFIDDENFSVKITNKLDKSDIEAITKLRELWFYDMPNVAEDDREFYNVLNSGAENVYHCILYYKGKAVSCETFELYKNCIMLWYVTHLGRYRKNIEDEYLKASIAEVRYTSLYFLVNWCKEHNIQRVYYEGTDPGNKKLYNYKSKITDGVIRYGVIKEREYSI